MYTKWRCLDIGVYMKSFIAKRVNSILVNLRYLRFKLLKYIENNKKICDTFDHNFKNIPLYIMRKVSLERYYFVSYDDALTLKISKMALSSFCNKTLHMYIWLPQWEHAFKSHQCMVLLSFDSKTLFPHCCSRPRCVKNGYPFRCEHHMLLDLACVHPMKWRLARMLPRELRRCAMSAGLILNPVIERSNTL